jgi:hypothetical protein
MHWKRCLMIAAIAAMSAGVRAAERGPLPALTLTNLAGAAVTTAQPSIEGAWLILYVQPDCGPCDQILKATSQAKHHRLAERLVVIVAGAGRAELDAIAARFPHLRRDALYADPTRDVLTRLKLPGVPAAIGLRGGSMEWTLAGVLADAGAVESVLASWVK